MSLSDIYQNCLHESKRIDNCEYIEIDPKFRSDSVAIERRRI